MNNYPKLKVLDLFAGLGGWSKAFADRGHKVTTVDINPIFKPTILRNVLELTPKHLEGYDVILASPPCESFSIASVSHHWKNGKPKTQQAIAHYQLAKHTLNLLSTSKAKLWIMENPRGMMRKLIATPTATITYCQYGEYRMKPTDLWYNGSIPLKKPCKPKSPCHEKAPRGSRTGTQGIKTYEKRSLIPYQLSLTICLEAERRQSKIKRPLEMARFVV